MNYFPWPQTMILPISASQAARITGTSHQCLVGKLYLDLITVSYFCILDGKFKCEKINFLNNKIFFKTVFYCIITYTMCIYLKKLRTFYIKPAESFLILPSLEVSSNHCSDR
jgi:hypothetical protein